MNILNALKNDEHGFLVSAELVLVGTILVIGIIVGLTKLSFNVNEELEDLSSAIRGINQTYYFTLASDHKGEMVGSGSSQSGSGRSGTSQMSGMARTT